MNTDILKKVSTYNTKVAGINYHLNYQVKSNLGVKQGYCMADPSNQYNENAIAIYNDRNKLIGYIPNEDLDEFAKWSEYNVTKFIGIICPFLGDDEKVKLYGNITFVKGDEYDCIEAMNVLRTKYQAEANEAIDNLEHQLKNLEQVKSLQQTNRIIEKNNQDDNSNGGCFSVILVAIICTLTAILL